MTRTTFIQSRGPAHRTHTSCSECDQDDEGPVQEDPDPVKEDDVPMYALYYHNRYPRSPSVDQMGHITRESDIWIRSHPTPDLNPSPYASSNEDPDEDYMDDMGLDDMSFDEAVLEAQYLLEKELEASRDEEDLLHALDPEDGLEPPSEEDSEEGEEAFRRLTRPEDEGDNFIDYWIDHDSPCEEEAEEFHDEFEGILPPSSENGEDVYRRLMDMTGDHELDDPNAAEHDSRDHQD